MWTQVNVGSQQATSSLLAQESVPGVEDGDPSLAGPCSWLPLGGVSERAQLVME